MSVTIQLDLPAVLAEKARAKGLLEPDGVRRLIQRELDLDEPMEDFRRMFEEMRSYPDDEPMTMDEIQAEVDAVREERRRVEFRLSIPTGRHPRSRLRRTSAL